MFDLSCDFDKNESFLFKLDDFKVPRQSTSIKTNYGSITVTVWPKPKTTHPKIMVQGKCYLAFVTFVVPLILKELKAATNLPLMTSSTHQDQDSENESDQEKSSLSSTSEALGRLEKEVLIMRNDLAKRFDSLLTNEATSTSNQTEEKFASLEKLLKENATNNLKLADSVDKLREAVEKSTSAGVSILDESDSQNLQKFTNALATSTNNQFTTLTGAITSLRSDLAQAS